LTGRIATNWQALPIIHACWETMLWHPGTGS
jgi:hypothetical protein